MSATVVIVYTLAVARLTLLVTTDEITRPVRERIIARLNPDSRFGPWLAYLIECPWCMSVWVAGIALPLASIHPSHPLPYTTAWILAASMVTGTLSAYIDRSQ